MSAPAVKRSLALAALMLLAAAPAALAQSKVGTALGEFLRIEPSARVAGMGNAGVTLHSGLDAAYYNPAAIAGMDRNQAEFSHSNWLADISYDYVAAAFTLGSWGNAYASVTSLGSGEMEVRTETQPLGTGERFSVSDVAIGLGYGRAITDRVSAGVQVTWLQETIWHSTASTVTLSVGTLYQSSEDGFTLGSSLTNFGTQGQFSGRDIQITYDNDPSRNGDNGALPGERSTDAFAVPVVFRVGAGLPIRINPAQKLRLALDAFHPSENTESMSGGAEWSYREMLSLRAGWQNALQQDAETGLTMGGGLAGKLDEYPYRMDYAWADHGRLGSTHRFTLGFDF